MHPVLPDIGGRIPSMKMRNSKSKYNNSIASQTDHVDNRSKEQFQASHIDLRSLWSTKDLKIMPEIKDISEYQDKCRLCLERREIMHSLFTTAKGVGEESPLTILTKLFKMEISRNDDGPKFLCYVCLSELDATINFVQKCLSAEWIITNVLNLVNSQNKTEIEAEHISENDNEDTNSRAPKQKLRKKKSLCKTKKAIQCDICEKSFKCIENLLCHQRLHKGEKPFPCDMCAKAFTKKDNLNVHKRRHSNHRLFSCDTCGASHYTAHELRVHKRTHNGDKPHECNICGRRFTATNNLYIHQRTHTGERPHQCVTCGKSFISKNLLSIHRRIHTGEKPYVCATCGKSFTSNKLAAHQRTHTGEKRHACLQCGRQFGSPNVLRIHMRHHTGEKPYPCEVCGQQYAHTQSLNKHRRRRHPAVTTKSLDVNNSGQNSTAESSQNNV